MTNPPVITSDNNLAKELALNFIESNPESAVSTINTFSQNDIIQLTHELEVKHISKVLEMLSLQNSMDIANKLNPDLLAQCLTLMDPEKGATIFGRVQTVLQHKLLDIIPPNKVTQLQEFLRYPDDSAGRLMNRRTRTYSSHSLVSEILAHLRLTKNKELLDFYIVDAGGKLSGVLSLREVAMAHPEDKLESLGTMNPYKIHDMASQDEVVKLLEARGLKTIPVVNSDNIFLGSIQYSSLIGAVQEEASENIQLLFGVSPDEKATSSTWFSVKKRLPWLQINLATGFLASAVVGIFEATISQITFLAVLLPVVAGQSGNTGSQSLAVTLRGMALREVKPRNWFTLAFKEARVGLINGIAVAIVTAIGVYLWSKSAPLSLLIGVCMVFSMIIAGISGALTPIILKLLRQDPATSSSIILTTVTDIVGFSSFLGMATVFSKYLISA